jgi:hypothetical protein
MPLILFVIWIFNYPALTKLHPDPATLNEQLYYLSPMLKIITGNYLFNYLQVTTLGFIMVVIQAYIFNNLINKHEVFAKFTNLSVIIYALFAFLFTYPVMFSGVVVANTFLLLAIQSSFSLYRQYTAKDTCFNIGILLGISALFFKPYLFFLPVFLIVMALMKSFNWREWILFLSGAFLMHYLYFFIPIILQTVTLANHTLDLMPLLQYNPTLNNVFDNNNLMYIFYILLVLHICSFVFYLMGVGYISVHERRIRYAILWLLLPAIILWIQAIYLQQWALITPVLLVPLAFIHTQLYLNTSYKWIFDTLLLIAVAGIIIGRIV